MLQAPIFIVMRASEMRSAGDADMAPERRAAAAYSRLRAEREAASCECQEATSELGKRLARVVAGRLGAFDTVPGDTAGQAVGRHLSQPDEA